MTRRTTIDISLDSLYIQRGERGLRRGRTKQTSEDVGLCQMNGVVDLLSVFLADVGDVCHEVTASRSKQKSYSQHRLRHYKEHRSREERRGEGTHAVSPLESENCFSMLYWARVSLMTRRTPGSFLWT
jgi:hypothetical protein